MAEYIERKRAIVDACNSLELYPSEYAKEEDALNKIPAADVAPVRHGRWVPAFHVGDCCYRCSECQFLRDAYLLDIGNYCPNCGAKMDGCDGNSDMA